ncbi:MAG: hypothetical protein KAI64_05765 [Thermoplasmata archaeon]|nr:hypothetical protein [Thermoplasmata archaeon]
MTSLLAAFLTGCLIGFSLILLIVSVVSYRRMKSARLLLVSAAFLIFFLKGLFLFAALVVLQSVAESAELAVMLVLDMIVLLFLYFAIAKR